MDSLAGVDVLEMRKSISDRNSNFGPSSQYLSRVRYCCRGYSEDVEIDGRIILK